MKKSELDQLMMSLGIAPNRKLGQNFLIDDNFLDALIRLADVKPGDRIIEVGPGFGALTSRLLKTGASVAAIEFDRKLAAWLRMTYANRGLCLIEGDACRVDIASIYGIDTPFRLISNLPYSAGTVIVANMLTLKTPPSEMFIMLQKEVAMRFAAKEDTDDYGALSIRIQAMYTVELVKTAPPQMFHPRPEVDSSVLRLTLRPDAPDASRFRNLTRLVNASFAHRRKKMLKQAGAVFGLAQVENAMRTLGIDPDIRAEKVSGAQFLRMADLLGASGAENSSLPGE